MRKKTRSVSLSEPDKDLMRINDDNIVNESTVFVCNRFLSK